MTFCKYTIKKHDVTPQKMDFQPNSRHYPIFNDNVAIMGCTRSFSPTYVR